MKNYAKLLAVSLVSFSALMACKSTTDTQEPVKTSLHQATHSDTGSRFRKVHCGCAAGWTVH